MSYPVFEVAGGEVHIIATGPQGPQGEQGAPGEPGSPGKVVEPVQYADTSVAASEPWPLVYFRQQIVIGPSEDHYLG